MVAMMVLSAVLAAQDPSEHHVRTTERMIRTLIEKGIAQSETFRRLVDILDRSDVIVYVEPKMTRPGVAGFLSHRVVDAGGRRYMQIEMEFRGDSVRILSLLAHELQHAVEVSQDPEARDLKAVDRLFARIASTRGCGANDCVETEAAVHVQDAVEAELKRLSGPSN